MVDFQDQLTAYTVLIRQCTLRYCSATSITLHWRHDEPDGVSNHQSRDCLLNRLFRRRSKKTSKLRVTGLCAGNSPGTGEFPAQRASNAENAYIWWNHHDLICAWYSNFSAISQFNDKFFRLYNSLIVPVFMLRKHRRIICYLEFHQNVQYTISWHLSCTTLLIFLGNVYIFCFVLANMFIS